MVDVGASHPELVRRWNILVKRCDERGWTVFITSSSRTYYTQALWYYLDQRGLWPTGPVANPNQDWGVTPWGWHAKGSLHMVQQDGFSHALDVAWDGPTTAELHALADTCGLRFPELRESWHMQWWGNNREIYPVEEPDMTPEQIGLIRDPARPDADEWGVMLLETVEPPTYKWYRYDVAIIFIHQGFKTWASQHP